MKNIFCDPKLLNPKLCLDFKIDYSTDESYNVLQINTKGAMKYGCCTFSEVAG